MFRKSKSGVQGLALRLGAQGWGPGSKDLIDFAVDSPATIPYLKVFCLLLVLTVEIFSSSLEKKGRTQRTNSCEQNVIVHLWILNDHNPLEQKRLRTVIRRLYYRRRDKRLFASTIAFHNSGTAYTALLADEADVGSVSATPGTSRKTHVGQSFK